MVEDSTETRSGRSELLQFSVRLREILGSSSVARFARECGITESTFRAYLAGTTEPGLLNLQRIARYRGMSLDEIASLPASMRLDTQPMLGVATTAAERADADDDLVGIPMLEGALSAGPGSMIEADPAFTCLYYRRDWVRREISTNIEALRLGRIKGRSMEKLLFDRDRVFIDISVREPRRGRVCVFRQEGDLRIKRVAGIEEDGILVTSDNNEIYPSEMLPARAIEVGDIEFCGLARWGERGFRL